ncbi:TPA: hypothetical protein N0F65_006861 [Lagenidium giganteum]|uniref:Peptidase C1A papain C-terminal domain-containing protein n=1 Tax=Lagenidium giganteum TaxID=4803 RepID=A0AAV2YJ90_9STRA|nr:TPA: hypothetical protein N0F65_006861 [Lagenidium giganteum]
MEMHRDSLGYGSVEGGREHDAFISGRTRKSTSSGLLGNASLSKVVLGVAVGVVTLGFGVTMHTTMKMQEATIMRMQQQMDAMHAAVIGQDVVSNSRSSHRYSKPEHIPYKFAVEHMTPLKTQDFRGTCWDFATVGVLEQTYRAQGIAEGWLKEDEYLAISEQAYGAEVLRLCSGPPGSPQQVACLIPGNSIWQNSTEGGESSELYYLVNGLKNSIFPDSICPYYPNEGNDTVCDGLTDDARAKNPLRFTLHKMDSYYDEFGVKKALIRDRQAMAFTTSMPYITHYYPCLGEFTDDPRCDPANPSCTLCPPELSMSKCCIPLPGGENYNMNGEFIAHRGMTLEGGHVMVLAGYNDLYRTKDGFTGGYILKNSWYDGVNPPLGPKHARGSHSLRYWMQEIGDWEERTMCPNSYSPHNWYQCGNSGEVVHRNGEPGARVPVPFKRSNAFREGIESCLSAETQLYAETNIQPLHLHCTDPSYCVQSEDYVYFVRNTTEWGDRMTMMCLFEYNKNTTESSEICLPPMLLESIAYIFAPDEAEVKENDGDVCGYYFYPYEVQRQYVTKFEGFYVNNYHIRWHPQSYAANQDRYPDLDYTEVIKSTKKQNQYEFDGPFPFARVVGGIDDSSSDEL